MKLERQKRLLTAAFMHWAIRNNMDVNSAIEWIGYVDMTEYEDRLQLIEDGLMAGTICVTDEIAQYKQFAHEIYAANMEAFKRLDYFPEEE